MKTQKRVQANVLRGKLNAMGIRSPSPDPTLSSLLSGSLLLRGRSRVVATAFVVVAYFLATPTLRDLLGNAGSALAALTALALAWLWGRMKDSKALVAETIDQKTLHPVVGIFRL